MLSEELSKYDAQMENATNKIIDVLRNNLFKGDESRLKSACRIADRMTRLRLFDGQLMVESPESYVMNYQCYAPCFLEILISGNSIKYRVDKPIAEIMEILTKVTPLESTLTVRKSTHSIPKSETNKHNTHKRRIVI